MPQATCCVDDACIPSGARWVFIGDSLTRYQYLDLVYTLQHWFQTTSAAPPACTAAAGLCIAPNFHRRRNVGAYEKTALSQTVQTFSELRRMGVLAHAWY